MQASRLAPQEVNAVLRSVALVALHAEDHHRRPGGSPVRADGAVVVAGLADAEALIVHSVGHHADAWSAWLDEHDSLLPSFALYQVLRQRGSLAERLPRNRSVALLLRRLRSDAQLHAERRAAARTTPSATAASVAAGDSSTDGAEVVIDLRDRVLDAAAGSSLPTPRPSSTGWHQREPQGAVLPGGQR